jgi:ADP-ribose pyrophosphatase YjhB (NUDIX family)
MHPSRIHDLVTAYLARHPEENERLLPFTDYLATNDAVFDRKNFNGHITTSAIVLDSTGKNILLIFHKFLQLHLQPGGHFEGDESLVASAAREALEETGVSVHLHPLTNGDHPVDIDAHRIPANPAKSEDAHWHFDFRYLFTADVDDFTLQAEEVTACGWFGFDSPEVRGCFQPHCLPKLELSHRGSTPG